MKIISHKILVALGIVWFLLLNSLFSMASSHSRPQISDLEEERVLFLGASNTAEMQWANGSYFTKLKDLGSPWTNLNMTNSSIDGWGVKDYFLNSSLVQANITSYQPTYLILSLGGNDFIQGESTSEFVLKYEWLLDEIRNNDINQEIKAIFVANIFWTTIPLFPAIHAKFFEFQDAIVDLANQESLFYLDFFGVTLERGDFYQSDGIHLNEEGHIAIAQQVHSVASEVILRGIGNPPQDIPYIIPPEPAVLSEMESNDNSTNFYAIPSTMVLTILLALSRSRKPKGEP